MVSTFSRSEEANFFPVLYSVVWILFCPIKLITRNSNNPKHVWFALSFTYSCTLFVYIFFAGDKWPSSTIDIAERSILERSSSTVGSSYLQSVDWRLVRCENGTLSFAIMHGYLLYKITEKINSRLWYDIIFVIYWRLVHWECWSGMQDWGFFKRHQTFLSFTRYSNLSSYCRCGKLLFCEIFLE